MRNDETAYLRMRRRTFEVFEVAHPGDKVNQVVDMLMLTLIIVNVVAVVISTVESVYQSIGHILDGFELFSIAVFTVEYLLRLWSEVERAPQASALATRARYAVSFMAIVDLLAILPAFLPMLLPADLRMMRLFRLLRLSRLLKAGRYSESVHIFGVVLRRKKEDLVITLIGVLLMMLISSSLMYFVENEAQPEAFPSIPAALWWGASALTTVGYGDVYPVTAMGRVLGVASALLDIGIFALPAGILASGFSDALSATRSKDSGCPVCGREQVEK